MTAPANPGRTRRWPVLGALASALLCLPSMGCLNLLQEDFQPPVDHAPVVSGLVPPPGPKPVVQNVGLNCAPADTCRADSLDDADGETLTVRWSVRLDRSRDNDGSQIVRLILFEADLDRLNPPVHGINYDFQPFQLDFTTVTNQISEADLSGQQKDRTQLLELGVSDGGFRSGTEEVRAPGQLLTYFSWPLKLIAVDACQ